MICHFCHDCLCGATGEAIVTKIEVLKNSLLRDELTKKFYIARYFLFSVRMLKPRLVTTEIEVDDGVNIGA